MFFILMCSMNFVHASDLHTAVIAGNFEEVNRLLDGGADVNAIDSAEIGPAGDKYIEYGTPLHFVTKVPIAKALIDAGANIDVKNYNDAQPLHTASWGGHADVVQFFLDSGADWTVPDKKGLTALHIASQIGQVPVIQVFHKHGADINYVSPMDPEKRTPLHVAGSKDAAKALVDSGANRGANIEAKNLRGETPLFSQIEAWFKNGLHNMDPKLDVIEYLLNNHANIEVQDNNSLTISKLFSNTKVEVDGLIQSGGEKRNYEGFFRIKKIIDNATPGFRPELPGPISTQKPSTYITTKNFGIMLAVAGALGIASGWIYGKWFYNKLTVELTEEEQQRALVKKLQKLDFEYGIHNSTLTSKDYKKKKEALLGHLNDEDREDIEWKAQNWAFNIPQE